MKIKKFLLTVLFLIIALLLLTTKSHASLYLNELNFDAQINSDGSMNVTETWNIDISDTNTLYKTFDIDYSKYSGITNVVVTQIGGQELISSDTWAYNMQNNYYYGGLNEDYQYEICWGVGLENKRDTRQYKISYKVLDAIGKYDDIAELYWQFIGENFKISAAKITGIIKLPANANSKDDIKVWGHVDTLNGEIYATSNNTVEFSLDNFQSGRYVEVRVAFPTDLVAYSGRTYSNREKIASIIEEETAWANEANKKREKQLAINKVIKVGSIIFGTLFSFLLLLQANKLIKKIRTTEKLKPIQDWDYFREIPGKGRTPGDALFVTSNGFLTNLNFGKLFSATLLNLCLKGYFKIETANDERGKEQVYISQKLGVIKLEYEEEKIASFIEKAIGSRNRITIKELQKYIKSHPEGVSKLIDNSLNKIKEKNVENGYYDKKNESKKAMYLLMTIFYFIISVSLTIFTLAMMSVVVLPIVLLVPVLLVVNAILSICINLKISALTQEGIDEKSKWKGLKKYMQDFSLLNEKDIPAITVWEEFLVYATAFGIADKVIQQLKLVYPEIENMDSINSTSYVYLMSHTNFTSSFNDAINSSISSAMSSGTGGGGGFSGGGGGGRRPEVADGGR